MPSVKSDSKIIAASMSLGCLTLDLEDGTRLEVFDDKQECCEIRHMSTDDDAASLIGSKLWGIEVKDGPDLPADNDAYHETQFVEISTDDGFITLVTHNEHNGYYSGFNLMVEISRTPESPA